MGLMHVSQQYVASYSMIFRMSADGDLLWFHGLNINETRSMDFVPVGNDSYVHTGATEIDDEMLLMETDSTGQQVWITSVELVSRYSSGHNLCQMPGGGFAVGGGAQEQAGFLDVWLVRFDNTVGIDEQQHSEQAGLICSCFPNPFKAFTTVTYSLESPSEVTLSVYDVSGRLVNSQRNTEHQSLTGSMIWLPDETCSTGCYFIVLEAGGQLASTSCVYIRE